MNCLIVLIPGIILKGNLIHDCPIVVIALEVKLNNNELTFHLKRFCRIFTFKELRNFLHGIRSWLA